MQLPDVFYDPSLSLADSTGTHSLYTTYKDYELMFHVSTMLPHMPSNRQQVGQPWLLSARAARPVGGAREACGRCSGGQWAVLGRLWAVLALQGLHRIARFPCTALVIFDFLIIWKYLGFKGSMHAHISLPFFLIKLRNSSTLTFIAR